MRASTFAKLSAALMVTAWLNWLATSSSIRTGRSDFEKTLLILHNLQRPDLGLVTSGRSGSVSESKDSLSQIRNPQYITLRLRRRSNCEMSTWSSKSRYY